MMSNRRPRRMGWGIAAAAAVLTALLPSALPPLLAAGEEAAPAGEAAGSRLDEDAVLRELCRYLNLSPSQLTQLLWIARQVERRRLIVDAEEERAIQTLGPLAAADPEQGARLRQALEQRRAQAAAEVVAFAAPQLARILTREQTALVWRLDQGDTPRYAAADSRLLEPAAGFATAPRGRTVSLFLGAGGADRDARVLLDRVTGDTVLSDVTFEVLGQKLRELDAEVTGPFQGRGVRQRGADARPFPQRVVECAVLEEMPSIMERLARRLFLSPRSVPVLEDALARGLPPAGTRARAPRGSLRPARDYRMERGLRDLTGRGPELEPLGGAVLNGLYHFDAGQGLQLADAGVTDHYALELIFRYRGGGDGYQKLIDFKNGAKDTGLYIHQGSLTFYTLAVGGVPQPGRDHRLRIERSRATRVVRVFLDSRPVFAFLDLDDEAVFENGMGRFFVDDRTTSGEQGAGALTSLIVWGPAR